VSLADTQNVQKTKVFLSYSRKDRETVARLGTALSAETDIQVFRDTEDILPTEEWRKRLEDLIAAAHTVVFCLSPESAASKVCAWEIEHARRLNKRIAPVVIREVDGQVPEGLSHLNYIFSTERDDFDKAVALLVAALRVDIAWIREHTRVGELALRWLASGKPVDQLLRGRDLDLAEQWAKLRPSNAPELTPTIHDFLATSRLEVFAAAKRARRQKIVIGALGLGILAVTVAALTQKTWLPVADVLVYRAINVNKDFLQRGAVFQECAYCPQMVVVPAGTFLMGSPASEQGRQENEGPQHKVTVGYPFAVSKFTITFEQWDACLEAGGCTFKPAADRAGRGTQPVMDINWNDAQEYATWISRLTGQKYRLLSEAEWEYAARAGTATRYWWGDDIKLEGRAMANCDGCGSKWQMKQAAPVGAFPPNAFGLHDLHGNVWQWTADSANANYEGAPVDGKAWTGGPDPHGRILRGGAWSAGPSEMRSAVRTRYPAGGRNVFFGFRVARALTP
jgi:formylglycine-generating enzyme required for sulfatase activity